MVGLLHSLTQKRAFQIAVRIFYYTYAVENNNRNSHILLEDHIFNNR